MLIMFAAVVKTALTMTHALARLSITLVEEAIHIFRQLVTAVVHLHKHGVVHRTLSLTSLQMQSKQ